MIKKVIVVLSALSLTSTAYSCELPRGESLTIGCTYKCDFFYRFRIIMTSWGLGYKTNIQTLDQKLPLEASLSKIDGLLIPGGADIDPKFYLNDIDADLRSYTEKNLHLVKFTEEGRFRDPFEYKAVKTYSENDQYKDLPLLGICRGLQMMSVAQGIPLYLDIKTELGIRNRRNLFDKVRISEETSLMGRIYRPETVRGFKLHHQGIRVPYYEANSASFPLTKVTAFSNSKKIAEAIEYTHRPALGVQYHPERSFSSASVPVFKWFLTKACEYKMSKKDI